LARVTNPKESGGALGTLKKKLGHSKKLICCTKKQEYEIKGLGKRETKKKQKVQKAPFHQKPRKKKKEKKKKPGRVRTRTKRGSTIKLESRKVNSQKKGGRGQGQPRQLREIEGKRGGAHGPGKTGPASAGDRANGGPPRSLS